MVTGTVKPTVVECRPLRAARQSLLDVFGCEFRFWCYENGWRQVPENWEEDELSLATLEFAPPETASHLEGLSLEAGELAAVPLCFDASNGSACLVLPISRRQRVPVAATACMAGVAPGMLQQLARLYLKDQAQSQELARLRQEHEAFLHQVTHDFEELTFLRCMSRLLEISDLTFDCVAMAETMLATLRPLLDADALVLVGRESAATDGEANSREILCWNGLRGFVSVETCDRLVNRFHDAAVLQPVVKNHFDRMEQSGEFPGVHSFILVPVTNATATIGWLLALNRNNEHQIGSVELPWGVSQLEFGTHEATLMTSSAAILATHSRNIDLFRDREKLLTSVIRALVSVIDAKDEYTCGHSERVALYAKRLAEELGHNSDFCERLYLAGLLHDIGKIGVSDAVLRKAGPLSQDEFNEVKQHPRKGCQILSGLEHLQQVLHGVMHHHEQYDGTGYPDRLAGRAIPLDGRILAVADAYDAMTSDRPYRCGMPQEAAEAILRSGAGRQWDPELVDAFFRCMPDILEIRKTYLSQQPQQRRPVPEPVGQPA